MATNDALLTGSPAGATLRNSIGIASGIRTQATAAAHEGGPSFPPPGQFKLTGRQKLRLVFLVIVKRVRFLAILAGVGVFIGYWDSLRLYWDRWAHPQAAAVRKVPAGREFFCPMDPQVTRGGYEPNGDVPMCPVCGMPLSLHEKPVAEELPQGVTGRVSLSHDRISLAGIETVAIGYRPMSRRTNAMGYITYDESHVSRVVSRVEGYVEKLFVDKSFALVHKGDPLAEIFSPEVYSAARELFGASRRNGDSDATASARNKLLLLGVGADDIDRMAAASEPVRSVVIRAPQSGYVVEKKIVAGASIEPKMTLLEIADLSSVWVEAGVYEKDLAFLSPGQAVSAKVDAWPQRIFRGELELIYPQVDMTTRTNRLRLRLDNAGGELRPGMHVHVMFDTPLEKIEPYRALAKYDLPLPPADGQAGKPSPPAPSGSGQSVTANSLQPSGSGQAVTANSPLPPGEGQGVRAGSLAASSSSANTPSPQPSPGGKGGPPQPAPEPKKAYFLVVPEGAVIDAGDKKIVYIERAAGQYEGHEVELGPQQDEFYPVIKGLNAGDKVAAAGNFLVDAEVHLNPATASTYFGASGGQSLVVPISIGKGEGDERIKAVLQSQKPIVFSKDDMDNINKLPERDRGPAMIQGICPITGANLGSMGVPIRIMLSGRTLFVCCKGCIAKAKRSSEATLKRLQSILQYTRQFAPPGCG